MFKLAKFCLLDFTSLALAHCDVACMEGLASLEDAWTPKAGMIAMFLGEDSDQ